MRVAESDKIIKNIKCTDEGENIRLTWSWPQGIEQVYAFTSEELTGGKLFTLQEYKKRGGYILRKNPGVSTYYIYPFLRKGGEDILCNQPPGQNKISYTNQTIINFSVSEKFGLPFLGQYYKNHEIILSSENDVPADIISYVKKENNFPNDAQDGVVYYFGEMLEAGKPLTRIVQTGKNEYISLFIRKENTELYVMKGTITWDFLNGKKTH